MIEREPPTSAIPRFSVTRPVTVMMILLTIIVVGYMAFRRIPLALYPDGMEGNQLYIGVSYPNATARDTEEKITRKVEDIVGTVPNVKKIYSYSSSGFASVRVEFQPGTNLKNAYALLSDRMDRVKPDLPNDVDRIWVNRWDQNDSPIMNIIAGLPPGMDDAFYRMDTFVKPAIQRIEGVGNVDIWGIQTRQVQVDLIDERLRAHRIDVSAMINNLRNQNFALSGGYVYEGSRKIYVRSLGRFSSPEEIGALIIDADQRLRLRDVANVALRFPKRDWMFRVDRQAAVGIQVTRESTGNIERISRDVRAALAGLEKLPPLAGIKFNVYFDQGVEVRDSINHLEEAGLWGGLFAAIVIYIFLRAPRMTGILTLSIPLSLLCTLIALYFMGWTLNMATMMGLLLAVGMVVDNAIVIVENIYRHRQGGMEATKASISGAGEVGLAVVMSTCTSIVVFLPLILMKNAGDFSFWMLRIGIPVIVSLVASLFIALVFVPLAAQRLSRGAHHNELKPIVWARERYVRSLRWVLSHRIDAAVIVILVMGSSYWYYQSHALPRPANYYGGNDTNFPLFFDLPSGGTLEDADVFFSKAEALLEKNRARWNIERFETRFRYNNGRIQAKLRADPYSAWYAFAWNAVMKWAGWSKPAMDRLAIEKEFREQFPLAPGVRMRSLMSGSSGGPQDAGMSITLYGEDTGTLLGLAEEAVRRLRTIPGLTSVDTDLERGGNELQIQLDRDRARRVGVNPQQISSSISYAMRGLELGRYYGPDGRELRVFAQLGEADRARLDDLRSMTFKTDSGIEVPLETVATLSVARTLGQIQREGRQTILRVTARAPRTDSRQLFAAVDKAMDGFTMPRGYRWDKGNYGNLDDTDREMRFALLLAITFVFLLMGLLFESFVLPLAVIIAVPFSFLGVYWTLYLTGTPLDNMAMIGVVILVGVVVNNAIVLVDMANRLRAAGRERFDALMEAGRHRFRPIMMTTLCTVSGLVPMALGNATIDGMPYAPLGRTMIGGLLAATLLTLVIVPLFYTFLDDLREHGAEIWRSAWSPKGGGAAEAEPAATHGAAAGVGRASRAE